MKRSHLLPLALLLCLGTVPALAEELKTPPDRPVDVTRIALDLRVDLEGRSLEGSATVALTALRQLNVVTLNAVDFEVAGVEGRVGEGKPETRPYDYDGEHLAVELPLTRGQTAELVVSYRVEDPEDGLYFFGPSEGNPRTPWQLWTQGEATSNRYWFPCVDHPDERQATAITARVKPGLTVISNGAHLGTTEEDGLSVWRFAQEREHVAYLVSLVVGTFDHAGETWRGKPLGYYVPPGRAADIPRSFARTAEMLDLFSELTGLEYPWDKYDQVVVEQFEHGGMENTGATTLNERTLHDERAHLDHSSEGLVAHELAHQWYGDLLTCRDWGHIWLNESFATFFAALWEGHARGEDAYAYQILRNAESGMRAGKDRPIHDRRYPYPWAMFDGRAYPKGSCVLHMLRRQLGDEAFWRGIQLYTRTHADSGVETHDLRRALERASGHNLERFFHDWVERPGHPDLLVELKRDANAGLLTIDITQRQKSEAYAFPAELELRFGKQVVQHTFPVRAKKERFVLAEARAPTFFRFDPREAVVLKSLEVKQGRGLWIAQLKQGQVAGRIRAARALGKDRHKTAVQALCRALRQDPFWGVRVEVAKVLGKVRGKPARDALLAEMAGKHPKVRRACVDALATRGKNAEVAQAVAARLEQGDASYAVEAACVEAYAKLAAEPRALLEAQLGKDSHNDLIRLAAIRGLRRVEDAGLVPTFVQYMQLEYAYRVRQEAARSLKLAGLPGTPDALRKQAVDALMAFLETANKRGRRAALDTLHELGRDAREALELVERVAIHDPQERLRKRAEEVAQRIRSEVPPDEQLTKLRKRAEAQEKELKALRNERKTLEKRIKRLEKALDAQEQLAKDKTKLEKRVERLEKALKGRRTRKPAKKPAKGKKSQDFHE